MMWVGNILVGGEVVIAFFFLFFIVALSERLKVRLFLLIHPAAHLLSAVDMANSIRKSRFWVLAVCFQSGARCARVRLSWV